VLGANLDALGLQHLANVKEAGEVLWLGIIPEQIVVNDGIAFIVFLVRQHHRRKDAGAILRLGKASTVRISGNDWKPYSVTKREWCVS
jgi:hypothetical protein